MSAANKVTSIVFAGLGGQGVLKASDIAADAAFRAGYDVKKSEIHGMSQRGGSVTSDVRYGAEVLSPMVPAGEADFLVVLDAGQIDNNRAVLRDGGFLVEPAQAGTIRLPNRKSLNVALLGWLSAALEIPEEAWMDAIRAQLPERLHEVNLAAFAAARSAAAGTGGSR